MCSRIDMQTIVTPTHPISAPDDDHHRHAQEEYAVKRQNERETGREWAGLDWTNPVRDEIATAWLRRSRSICAGVYEPRKARRDTAARASTPESFVFCKSSLLQPFLFLLQVSLYGFPRLFTVTSEHIRLYTF